MTKRKKTIHKATCFLSSGRTNPFLRGGFSCLFSGFTFILLRFQVKINRFQVKNRVIREVCRLFNLKKIDSFLDLARTDKRYQQKWSIEQKKMTKRQAAGKATTLTRNWRALNVRVFFAVVKMRVWKKGLRKKTISWSARKKVKWSEAKNREAKLRVKEFKKWNFRPHLYDKPVVRYCVGAW